jgi:hypothetical protein
MTESTNLIYTPQEKIPLGEPVILPNGAHGLKVKWRKGKRDVTEIVTLDKLHELVAQGNIKASGQRSP